MTGNPSYSSQAAVGYNSSPPADDGSLVAANLATWAGVKTKLADPVKTLADAINTAVSTSFAAVRMWGAVVASKSSAYPIVATDDGTIFLVTGNTTLTLGSAATLGAGFRCTIKKTDSNATTAQIATTSAQTIDGSSTNLSLVGQYSAYTLESDGSNWHVIHRVGFADGTVALPSMYFHADPDNGAYRIGANNWALSVGGAKALELDSSGAILLPLQTSFLAYPTNNVTNATGDGTNITVVSFGTEIYDRNADFASSTLTAPLTGLYDLATMLYLTTLGAGHTQAIVQIVTSNRSYYVANCNAGAMRESGNGLPIGGTVIGADMDAADTATVRLQISGSTKTVGYAGTQTDTFFSGKLAA